MMIIIIISLQTMRHILAPHISKIDSYILYHCTQYVVFYHRYMRILRLQTCLRHHQLPLAGKRFDFKGSFRFNYMADLNLCTYWEKCQILCGAPWQPKALPCTIALSTSYSVISLNAPKSAKDQRL